MKNQSGRSMIEMLGVLAIIGVLSLGGVAVFNAAMNRQTANNLTYDVMLMAESTVSLGPQEQMSFDASTKYDQMSSVRDANGIVNVTVQDVENDICEVLLSKAGNDVFEFRDAGGNALDACEDDTTDVVFAFTGNGLDGNNPENAECIPGCDAGHECKQGQCCPTDETCKGADNNPNMIAKECLCECNLNCADGKVPDLTCTTCVCEDGKTGEMCDKNCPAVGEYVYEGVSEEECLACPDAFWDNYSESCTHCADNSYCPVFDNQSDAESCVAACADSEYKRQWVKSEEYYGQFLCLPADETSCPNITESSYMTKSDCYECENTYWHEGVCRGCGAELASSVCSGGLGSLPYSTYDETIENLNRCDQYLSYTFIGGDGGDLFLATNRECPDINEHQTDVPIGFCYQQCQNAIPGDGGICAGCGSPSGFGFVPLSESMEQLNVQICQQAGYQWTCYDGGCYAAIEE